MEPQQPAKQELQPQGTIELSGEEPPGQQSEPPGQQSEPPGQQSDPPGQQSDPPPQSNSPIQAPIPDQSSQIEVVLAPAETSDPAVPAEMKQRIEEEKEATDAAVGNKSIDEGLPQQLQVQIMEAKMQPEEEGVEIVEGSFPTPNIDLQDEEETVTEIEGPRRPERSHSNLQGLSFSCSVCAIKAKSRPALYVNLLNFKVRRFLCRQCVTTEDRYLLPLSMKGPHPPEVLTLMRRITINKSRPDRNVLRQKIQRIFDQQINKKLNSYIEMLNQYAKKIKTELVMQFLAVTHTFNENTIEGFLAKLKSASPGDQQQEEIQLIVNALRYSGCRDFNYTDQLLEAVKLCFESVGALIEKEQKDCRTRFDGLEKQLMKFRIGRVYEDKRNAIKNYLEKDKLKNTGKNSITTDSRTKSSQVSAIDVIDIEEEPLGAAGQNQAPSTTRPGILQPIIRTGSTPIIPKFGQKVTFNLNPQLYPPKPSLIVEKPMEYQMGGLVASKSSTARYYTVVVTAETCEQIWVKERKFEDQVRRLIIYYENQPERALKAMVYYCKLEEIVLFDSRMARKEMVVFYLDNFPHLKKIEMNCLNDFDTSCIEKIMKNQRHHHIETLFVGPNYHGNMASLDDKQWFVEETAKQRTGGLTIADQTVLMGLFPNLQNIWLSQLDYDLIFRLKQLKSLKYLALGSMEGPNIEQLNRRTWQVLSRLTGLVSLTFYKLQLEPDFFQMLLIRNKESLQTIVLHDCRKLRDNTLTVLRQNATRLKELSLYRCGEVDFKGEDIWEIRTLDTLIIRECENADRQKAEQTVRNLTNLSHLSLTGCPWVTDDMVKQISTLKHLLFLNLYNTNVTNSAAIHLQAATQLRALHIGGTKMRGQAIVDITKSSTMVKKLGLRGLGKSSNPSGRGTIASLYLMKVGVNLPFLTHLDIAGCDQLQDSVFDYLKNLRFISVWMASSLSQSKKQELARKGVIVIDQNLE